MTSDSVREIEAIDFQASLRPVHTMNEEEGASGEENRNRDLRRRVQPGN